MLYYYFLYECIFCALLKNITVSEHFTTYVLNSKISDEVSMHAVAGKPTEGQLSQY